MQVRFGFVAMSMKLENASPSKTITYKSYEKLPNDEVRLHRLEKISRQNLQNSLRVLIHAHAQGAKLYRFSSKLIPLATHPDVIQWDYEKILQPEFMKIGEFVKKNNIRVSAHPDHFTLLNSTRKEVIDSSKAILKYHKNLFHAMGLDKSAKLVLHVGSAQGGKEKAIERFCDTFEELSKEIKDSIILENDDKSYTTREVLHLCNKLQVPMVLDVHHHKCNPGEKNLQDLLPKIFSTWKNTNLIPKIHFSSAKSERQFRHHANYIDIKDFMKFLYLAKNLNQDFDVMIEAKTKDLAMIRLLEDLKKEKNIKFVEKSIIEF